MKANLLRLISKLLHTVPAHAFEALVEVDERLELVRAAMSQDGQLNNGRPPLIDPSHKFEVWSAFYLARHLSRMLDKRATLLEEIELHRFIEETDGVMLERLGTDALRWATECASRGVTDADDLLGWFASAIEAGRSAGRTAALTEVYDASRLLVSANPPYPAELAHKIAALETTIAEAPHAVLDAVALGASYVDAKAIGDGTASPEVAARYAIPRTPELDAAAGVGPGTEFPALVASPVTAIAPDGTTTQGIGITHVRNVAPENAIGAADAMTPTGPGEYEPDDPEPVEWDADEGEAERAAHAANLARVIAATDKVHDDFTSNNTLTLDAETMAWFAEAIGDALDTYTVEVAKSGDSFTVAALGVTVLRMPGGSVEFRP